MEITENTYVSLGIVLVLVVAGVPVVYWAAGMSVKVGTLVKIGRSMLKKFTHMERKLAVHDRLLEDHGERLGELEKKEE